MKHSKTILGLDPGTHVTGYGIIQSDGQQCRPLDYGCIRLPSQAPFAKKTALLFDAINQLLTHYPIDEVALEGQYVHKNVQSALKLGIAKGIALLAAAKRDLPISEYSPTKAKLAVTGRGSASKEYVQHMVQLRLGLPSLPKPKDASDALALALCHSHQKRIPLCSTT